MSKLLYLFLIIKLRKEGFKISDSEYCYLKVEKENMEFVIWLEDKSVSCEPVIYSFVYDGSMDVEGVTEDIKHKNKLGTKISEEIKSYLNWNETDMKKYLIEHVEDIVL